MTPLVLYDCCALLCKWKDQILKQHFSLLNVLSETHAPRYYLTEIEETRNIFLARKEHFDYFFRQDPVRPLSVSLKTRFPYLVLSFLSYIRALRASSLLVFQSGSFINASLILATKRLTQSGIPKRTTTLPSSTTLIHSLPSSLSLFGIQQVSFSNVAHFLSQNIHINQTRSTHSFVFFVNVLLPRLLLFSFRSTPRRRIYSLPFQFLQSLTSRFPLV